MSVEPVKQWVRLRPHGPLGYKQYPDVVTPKGEVLDGVASVDYHCGIPGQEVPYIIVKMHCAGIDADTQREVTE